MVNLYKELKDLYPEISPKEFYRAIFPSDELDKKGAYTKGKYTGIACEFTGLKNAAKDNTKKQKQLVKRYSITDDLDTIDELLISNNFVIISPISYVGKSRKTDNAAKMYAFCIEIDNLRTNKNGKQVGFYDLVHHYTDIDLLPMPNYIVASGSGLHLYYLFEQPLVLYENVKKSLINFKKDITPKFWNRYVTDDFEKEKIQFESPFQGFRLAGGVTKRGERTRVFEVSTHPITVERLNEYVYDEKNKIDTSYMNKYTLDEAREQFPEWYEKRVINKEPRGTWVCKRDLYDWWKRKIAKAEVGHRYHCLFCLSVYAIKCNIDEDELISDLYSYLEPFDKLSSEETNHFTEKDVMDALQAYYDKGLITYPISSILHISGIPIQKNKRNGRKQSLHLKMARSNLEILSEEKGKALQGRKEKKEIVRQWRAEHPNGKKIECEKETGLSRHTVLKWWSGEEAVKVKKQSKGLSKEMQEQLMANLIQYVFSGKSAEAITDDLIKQGNLPLEDKQMILEQVQALLNTFNNLNNIKKEGD